MKNKLSVSLLTIAMLCIAPTGFSSDDVIQNEQDTIVGNEMSDEERHSMTLECEEIGIDAGMEGDELNSFISECANMYVVDSADAMDSQEQGDTLADDTEEMAIDDQQEPLEDSIPVYVEES